MSFPRRITSLLILSLFLIHPLQINQSTALIAPSPPTDNPSSVVGNQPWITILCKFADVSIEPQPLSFFQVMYQNTYPGLDHYWREATYNTMNVTGSSAAGWFTLPQPRAYYVWDMWGNGHPTFDATRANPDCLGAADPTVNFQGFYGIQMMFNAALDGSSYGSQFTTLTLDGITRDWATTSLGSDTWINLVNIAHEMGHGFGLPHSANGNGKVYQNQWDVMSDTTTGCTRGGVSHADPVYGCLPQHPISFDKDLDGWIDAARRFVANPGHGRTITLQQLALPPAGDYLMARLPINGSTTHFYTVEARRLSGYDAAHQIPGNAVIIHDVMTTRMNPAYVVDADGNDNSGDAGAMWLPGETFTDAANGIKIVIKAETGTGFVVGVYNQVNPLETLTLSGPTTGLVNTPYTFTADSGPTTATQPITCTWSATGLPGQVHPQAGFNDSAIFTWSSGGVKTVSVTTENPGEVLTRSQTFTIPIPPSSVTISGPSLAATGQAVTFNAALAPPDTTAPITYTWSATGLPDIVHSSSALTDSASFTWTAPGAKTVSLTATNTGGSASANHNLTLNVPPADVALAGPTSVIVGQVATYNDSVSPPEATTPITHTWSATGLSGHTHSSGLADTANFTWATPGVKTVSIQAANQVGVASDSLTVTVVQPPTSVIISGQTIASTSEAVSLSAAVSPANTTPPLSYHWTADEQAPVNHSGGVSDVAVFTWTATGVKQVHLTVTNAGGSVQANFTVTISAPPPGSVAPSSVTLGGPVILLAGQAGLFTADVLPLDATQPITYTWQATDQTSVVRVDSLHDQLSLTWTTPGLKTISVIASNRGGSTQKVFQLSVIENPALKKLFLPLVKN